MRIDAVLPTQVHDEIEPVIAIEVARPFDIEMRFVYETAGGWVLSLVFINGRAFTSLVLESSRRTQSLTQASSKKISAQELESQFVQANVFPVDAKLHCEPGMTMWDYICSYTPKDRSFPPRLHFGVNVDSKRWVQVSRTVPLGFPIPPLGL